MCGTFRQIDLPGIAGFRRRSSHFRALPPVHRAGLRPWRTKCGPARRFGPRRCRGRPWSPAPAWPRHHPDRRIRRTTGGLDRRRLQSLYPEGMPAQAGTARDVPGVGGTAIPAGCFRVVVAAPSGFRVHPPKVPLAFGVSFVSRCPVIPGGLWEVGAVIPSPCLYIQPRLSRAAASSFFAAAKPHQGLCVVTSHLLAVPVSNTQADLCWAGRWSL